jgi:hypothetical protein
VVKPFFDTFEGGNVACRSFGEVLTSSSNRVIREIETELVCPGGRPRRALFFARRGATGIREQAKVLLPMTPALVLCLIFVVVLRLIATRGLVFAREIPRACRFRCY